MSAVSHHLQETARLEALRAAPTRPLTDSEIQHLEANNNRCLPGTDWSTIRVLESASPEHDPDCIRNTCFGGQCALGSFPLSASICVDGVDLPAGIYNTTVVDSVVLDGARVSDTTLVSRCVVGQNAAIVGCGSIVMKGNERCSFSNGRSIALAVEVGGRDVPIFAEMTLEDAAAAAGDRSNTQWLEDREEKVMEYAEKASAGVTIISDGARLLNCLRVENSFVGQGAMISEATVINSTVLSSTASHGSAGGRTVVSGGALVEDSIVQWGCEVSSMAIVSGSLMCATSHVERHAKLLDSVLGPCSGAAEGEITSSLVGPFVGFHHQALLIACFWPAGRGNIGYGANVGSNHTGKAPDQEIWPGEGVFFGLATSIKFPSNFARAPYTLVATGVVALPQRVEMPFSLINSPGKAWPEKISPAFNEIMPGWILSDNLYMVLRGETKFLKRGEKARRLGHSEGQVDYEHEAFRPSTVRMMLAARKRLKDADGSGIRVGGETVYTSKQVSGLGKNYMLEKSRLKGIRAYTDFIKFYCVRAMWRALQAGEKNTTLASGPKKDHSYGKFNAYSTITRPKPISARPRVVDDWHSFALPLLVEEFGASYTIDEGLQEYVKLQRQFATSVLVSKQKDDKRGPRVIDGYADAHGKAEKDDKVALKALADAQEQALAVAKYVKNAKNRM